MSDHDIDPLSVRLAVLAETTPIGCTVAVFRKSFDNTLVSHIVEAIVFGIYDIIVVLLDVLDSRVLLLAGPLPFYVRMLAGMVELSREVPIQLLLPLDVDVEVWHPVFVFFACNYAPFDVCIAADGVEEIDMRPTFVTVAVCQQVRPASDSEGHDGI